MVNKLSAGNILFEQQGPGKGAHVVLAVKGLPVVGQREHDFDAILRRLVQHKVQAPEGSLVVQPCSRDPAA